MVVQVREILFCPVFVNTRVTPVTSTFETLVGVFFMEDAHALIFPRRPPVPSIKWRMRVLLKKLFRNLDCFDVGNVIVYLLHHMLQSKKKCYARSWSRNRHGFWWSLASSARTDP